MNNRPFSLEQLSAGMGTTSVELPADVVTMLKAEAKVHRKPIAAYLREWLEDQADGREATKRLKSLRTGKTQAIPAAQVYADLGI